jgi:hypothetical protein
MTRCASNHPTTHQITENKAKVPLTKGVAMGREMPRSEVGGGGAYVSLKSAKRKEGDERPTDNPTSGACSPGHSPLDCRLEVLPYPAKHDAANDEKEATDAEPQAWVDEPHNSLCDHSCTPHPESGAARTMTSELGSRI